MTQAELETLAKTLDYLDSYFTGYCELTDRYVLRQEEIDGIEDNEEKDILQEIKNCDDLVNESRKIILKYKEVK